MRTNANTQAAGRRCVVSGGARIAERRRRRPRVRQISRSGCQVGRRTDGVQCAVVTYYVVQKIDRGASVLALQCSVGTNNPRLPRSAKRFRDI